MKISSNHMFWLQILNYETCVLRLDKYTMKNLLLFFLLTDYKKTRVRKRYCFELKENEKKKYFIDSREINFQSHEIP